MSPETPHPAAPRSRSLQQTTISGVPTFFVDSGQTPFATLTFRAGIIDETLPTRGWTHLIEHMAMHGLDNPRIQCNAHVELIGTEFQVAGEQDAVTTFLATLTRWLAEPDLTTLDHESAILRREAARNRSGDMAAHLDHRFGAEGAGVVGYFELGLSRASGEGLRDLLASKFTAGNAALALNFAPPPDLELFLPPGRPAPLPESHEYARTYPSQFAGYNPTVSASGFLTDGWLSPLVAELALQAVTKRLRHELGASYATTPELERIDDGRLLLCLSSDIDPTQADRSVRHLADVVRELSAEGFDAEEFEGARSRALRSLDDDLTGAWQAFSSAQASVREKPPVTAQEARDRLAAATLDGVNEQLREFARTVIYASPRGVEPQGSIPVSKPQSQPKFEGTGTTFFSWDPRKGERLHLSARTIMASSMAFDHVQSIDAAVALLCFPDGARTLVTRDGGSFFLDNRVWHRGDRAVALLDKLVPEELHVPMEGRDAEQLTDPPSRVARAMHPIRRMFAHPRMYTIWMSVAALLAIWGAGLLLTGHPRGAAEIVLGGLLAYGLKRERKAKARLRQEGSRLIGR